MGFFHADPHPGNLVATEDGSLAYFDFGMMGDIPRHYRVGLIRMVRTNSGVLSHEDNIPCSLILDIFCGSWCTLSIAILWDWQMTFYLWALYLKG